SARDHLGEGRLWTAAAEADGMSKFNGNGRQSSIRHLHRLLGHLNAYGRLVDEDRSPAEERLVALLGREQLQAARARMAAAVSPKVSKPRAYTAKAMARLAQMTVWQWAMFLVALGCGATVSIIGVIDLLWHARGILGALGAIAIVTSVYVQSRRHRVDQTWIGS